MAFVVGLMLSLPAHSAEEQTASKANKTQMAPIS